MKTAARPKGAEQWVRRLEAFWRERGCVSLPPCGLQIPLALYHPETVFRLVDPEPWRGVCVQPITRAGDARGGRHPARASRHLQLHAVLEGVDPSEVRGWVIDSLGSSGLDGDRHELALLDRPLRSEALDARGEGWRLRLDGLGIGRITFWHRFAGRDLDRTLVDVALGVERLAMAIQGTSDVYGAAWDGASDEDPASSAPWRRRSETEQARYIVEVADAANLQALFDLLLAEARRCLEAELAQPAYERAVEALSPLEMLATRGALDPHERRRLEGAVRDVVCGAVDLRRGERARSVDDDSPPEPGEHAAETLATSSGRAEESS